MSQYPFLVQIALDTVEQLIEEWTMNPHFLEREIDIQSELRSRLSRICSWTGRGYVVIHDDVPSGRETYRFSRVACEPNVAFKKSEGGEGYVRPDVVIWKGLADPTAEPDHWPILWACEIKYKSQNSSDDDIKKLSLLLDQKRIDYGCSLDFRTSETIDKPIWTCESTSHGKHLWQYSIVGPSSYGIQPE
jgi:hypothetical protein